MSKLFRELPTEIEMYNPDEQWESFNLNKFSTSSLSGDTTIETYDDDNLLHSYDDYPAIIEYGTNHNTLVWYKHGVVFREENKPAIIELSKMEVDGALIIYEYATLDFDSNRQTYGDFPSYISLNLENFTTVFFKWHQKNELSRSGDLPAVITYRRDSRSEVYYLNGLYHRDNGLPAVINNTERTCFVLDKEHREDGPAQIEMHSIGQIRTWYLYGHNLKNKTYNQIKLYQDTHKVPIWISFIRELDLVTDSGLQMFMDKDNCWNSLLPPLWIFKALGVNEEKWIEAHRGYKQFTSFKKFLDIITYNENDFALQKH